MGAAPASSSSQGPSACTPPPGGGRVPASSGCHGERTHWEAWRPRRPPRVLLPLPTGHSRTPFLTAGGLAGPPGGWSRGPRSPAEAQSSGGVGGPPQAEAPEAGRHPLGSRRARAEPDLLRFVLLSVRTPRRAGRSGHARPGAAHVCLRVLAGLLGPTPGGRPPRTGAWGGFAPGPPLRLEGWWLGLWKGPGQILSASSRVGRCPMPDAAQAPAAPPAVAARPLHSPAAWCSACWAGRPGWRQRGAGAPPHRRPAHRAPCWPRPLAGRVPGGRVHARAHAQGRTRAGGLALRLRPAEGEAVRCGGGGPGPRMDVPTCLCSRLSGSGGGGWPLPRSQETRVRPRSSGSGGAQGPPWGVCFQAPARADPAASTDRCGGRRPPSGAWPLHR